MPDTINGHTVSDKGHRLWQGVDKSMLRQGKPKSIAAAGATSKLKDYMKIARRQTAVKSASALLAMMKVGESFPKPTSINEAKNEAVTKPTVSAQPRASIASTSAPSSASIAGPALAASSAR